MLQNNPKLKSLIDNLWNTFWSGGIANPLTAIEQITYLLFIKRLDEIDTKKVKDATWNRESYDSKFDGDYKPYVDEEGLRKELESRPIIFESIDGTISQQIANAKDPRRKSELRWSFFKDMAPAEKMLEHVRYNVFPFIKSLNGNTSPFTRHMANAVFIIEKPSLLVEAVKKIEEIFIEITKDAKDSEHAFQDIQGDVYEMLLSEIATAGKNGQFRTPRHIIKLMADLLQPQLGHRICDPSCGTGGFLVGAYQYILTQTTKKTIDFSSFDVFTNKDSRIATDNDGFARATISAGLTKEVQETLEKSFYGYDIDITMVRLGLMNLMMHGIDNPNIDYQDTLSKSFVQDKGYDIIFANPPFTGNIDKGDINETLTLPTTKTELLFVERIFNLLRPGGRAAIIVPQGVLFGAGKAFVQLRKKLVEEAELTGVVTLPSGVFKPYAGVATAILLFTRGGETERTWFYEMKSDGYDLNDKRTEKFIGNKRDYGDLQDIVKKYQQRDTIADSGRTTQCFFVPKAELVENDYDLSLSKYKQEVYEEVKYEAPKDILKKLIGEDGNGGIEKDIMDVLKELKGIVG